MTVLNERRHAVLLSGLEIGVLVQRGDHVMFTFTDDYWRSPDRKILGVWFEDNPNRRMTAALRLPAWFSNLLPEGVLRRWIARDAQVSEQREMELLLRVGHDLPGAMEVLPDSGSIAHWIDRASESEEALSGAQSPYPELLKFSLAGVGLKFSMLRGGDRLSMPAHGVNGDWILKMPDPSYPHVPLNEYLMMSFAQAVGINVPPVHLFARRDIEGVPDQAWPDGEERAYGVRRFDRTPNGRVHIEDFAQVRGFYPERKYEGSFETIGALAYRGFDIASLREFARRMVFNIIIGNGDAHMKNWSLIYPQGQHASLSPAYDLVSTAPLFGGQEDLGLKFGGSKSFAKASWRDFDNLEQRLKATGAGLSEVVEQTVGAAESQWSQFADQYPELASVSDWISRSVERSRKNLLDRP